MSNLTPAYAEWPTSQSSAIAHAGLMGVAWVFLFPAGLACSISGSRYALSIQSLFVAFNLLGLCFGSYYTHSTPDLYKGNIHRELGWTTIIFSVIQLITSIVARRRSTKSPADTQSLPREASSPKWLRLSQIFTFTGPKVHSEANDSQSGSDENLEGLLRDSDELDTEKTLTETDSEPAIERLHDVSLQSSGRLQESKFWRFWGKVSNVFLLTVNLAVAPLGFVVIISGLIVYAGIYRGSQLFNGIAYILRGSILCIYGVFTFLRWIGCFDTRGWAWNAPVSLGDEKVPLSHRWTSAGCVESILILSYGLISIFLEILAGMCGTTTGPHSGNFLTALLFCGAGVCGLVLEIRTVKRHLWPRSQFSSTPQTTPFINPLPSLTLLILGLISISRQPETEIERVMDVQWGGLVLGFAAARLVTCIIRAIRPTDEGGKFNPPSELVASYCIMTSGLTMTASSRDIVHFLDIFHITPDLVLVAASTLTIFVMVWTTAIVFLLRYSRLRG